MFFIITVSLVVATDGFAYIIYLRALPGSLQRVRWCAISRAICLSRVVLWALWGAHHVHHDHHLSDLAAWDFFFAGYSAFVYRSRDYDDDTWSRLSKKVRGAARSLRVRRLESAS